MESLLFGFLVTFGGIIGIGIAAVIIKLLWNGLHFLPRRSSTDTITTTTDTEDKPSSFLGKWLVWLSLLALKILLVLELFFPSLSPLWWQPNPWILLHIFLVGLVFLWLAPPTTTREMKFVRALVGLVFAWYVLIAVTSTGLGIWGKQLFANTDSCLRDPNCSNYDGPPVYNSGQTIWIRHQYNSKDKRQVFRFNGTVTLYNNKACSMPQIGKFGDQEELKIRTGTGTHAYYTVLEAPPNKTLEVQVWLKELVPCPPA